MGKKIQYSVFTKPWRDSTLREIGEWLARIGVDGIELPVRPGYQVEPNQVARLPETAAVLGEFGVRIFSVAGPADKATITACADAGVPMIRVMARINENEPYLEAEARIRREYEALIPLLERCGVQLGVQNHCGRFVSHAAGLARLLHGFEPRHIAAVWDAAHNALQGEDPDYALDLIWPHLGMVNLKNAFWQRTAGPEAAVACWRPYWTSGMQGLASWPKVTQELLHRGYQGVLCLTAEYSGGGIENPAEAKRLLAQDVAFLDTLIGKT